MTPTERLDGKRILVTGGTTGIGSAIVALLVQKGARVLTFGRHQGELDDALAHARFGNALGDVFGLTADVTKVKDLRDIFQAVDDKLGGLDMVVANAGLAADPVQDSNTDEWRYVVETNFTGYLATAQPAITRLKQAGGGHLIFIGSISAERKSKGSSVYAATKAGIQVYAETLRKEVAEDRIKVTWIEPGTVGSDMQEASPEEQSEKIARDEMLYAEELADTVVYALTRSARTDIVSMRVEPLLQK